MKYPRDLICQDTNNRSLLTKKLLNGATFLDQFLKEKGQNVLNQKIYKLLPGRYISCESIDYI